MEVDRRRRTELVIEMTMKKREIKTDETGRMS